MQRNWVRATTASVGAALLSFGGDVCDPARESQHFRTPLGALYATTLTDHSRVVLNTESSVYFRFNHDSRMARLSRGEALFRISPSDPRPFVISSGDISVSTANAVFSVRMLEPTDIQLHVLSGSVILRETLYEGWTRPFELEARLGGEHTYDIDNGALSILPFPLGSAHCTWAWEHGALCIADQPLAAAVAEVNRYIPRSILIADPSLASLRVGGWFDIAGLLPSFPDALEKTFGLRVIVRDEELLLFAHPQELPPREGPHIP